MSTQRHRGTEQAAWARESVSAGASCILVGTYRPEQMRDWVLPKGYYNYPIRAKAEDTISAERLAHIKELWLYNRKTGRKCFSAEFVRIATKNEPEFAGYQAGAKQHGEGGRYFLFKVAPLDRPSVALRHAPVVVRLADFAHDGDLKAGIKKVYLGGNATDEEKSQFLGRLLPADVCKCGCRRLKACAKAVQLDFLDALAVNDNTDAAVPFPAPKEWKFTFIDLFAGIGGIRLGYQLQGGKCVFSSEWDENAAKTYYANFGERPYGDIQQIDPDSIPDFDVLLAGFPCQPFSIIGDKEGFKHETQGTLFFNIERILLAKKPKAFMLENVRNLTAHDGGRTFKIIIRHLRRAGYDVHYKVLNALDYGVPQKRERIIICGFRNKVDFEFPPPIPAAQRKTVADIIDEGADNDKSLRVRPAIRESRLARLKDKRFPRPYISHENVAGAITPHNYSCALRAGASANYILINDERRPSPREMLRIQGFPDDFRIVVNYGQIKRQTGNSVAVPVISAVAAQVVKHLSEMPAGVES